ncbi:ATP-binding protein [Streptomyces sp. MS1.AVA.4]|uniref:ATP-binding protein n=1 Tax=Streptomyces pratisoli TaxID=3139917 RepID=A0ACC6QIG2_9ACTN
MSLSQQRRFPRSARSVGAARSFALDVLAQWGITDRHDDVQLCVSELATNALQHGVPAGREFCVGIEVDGALLRVHVRDSGDGRPEVQSPGRTSAPGVVCASSPNWPMTSASRSMSSARPFGWS